jgi:NADH:ubiquinone oxidoreductase subunit 3 (subunit A)
VPDVTDGWLASPLLWYGVMVGAGLLLYAWAARVAPPFRPAGAKATAYTGGEAIPGQAYRPGYDFFHVALFFVIMHVAAILLATAPRDVLPWSALAYLAVVATSVLVLRWGR